MNTRWSCLFAALLSLAIGLFSTWPLAASLTTHVPVGSDNLYVAWSLAWVADSLRIDPSRIFEAPIFFPARGALAFSDTNVSTALLVAPLYWLTGNPALALGVVVLGGYALCAAAAAALARNFGVAQRGAVFVGVAFACSPIRATHLDHSQLQALWWLPLALLALDRFLRGGRPGAWLALLVVSVVAQFYTSLYLATFTVGALLLSLGLSVGTGRSRIGWRRGAAGLGAAAFVAAGLLVPLAMAYVDLRSTWAPARTLAENLRYSASPLAYLSTYPDQVLWGRLLAWATDPVAPWEKYLFPGLATLLLALLSIRRAPGSVSLRLGMLLSVAGFVASLGPYLVWGGESTGVPLPYLAGYELAMPLRALRAPARWSLLVAFGLALATGPAAARLPRPAWGAAVLLLALESAIRPFPLTALPPRTIALEAELARGRGALVEVPFAVDTKDRYRREPKRMFRALRHRRPIANGYSGYTPPPARALARLLAEGPAPGLADLLATWDLRTIVVHRSELTPAVARRWYAFAEQPGVRVLSSTRRWLILEVVAEALPPAALERSVADLRLPAGERGVLEFADALGSLRPVSPQHFGWHRARASWTPESGAAEETWAKVYCPPAFGAGLPVHAPLVRAPTRPGRYRVAIEGPCVYAAGRAAISR